MRDPSPRTDRSAIDVKCKGEHHQNQGFSSIDRGEHFEEQLKVNELTDYCQ